MRIPTCNEVAGRCICCGIDIFNDQDHNNDCVKVATWIRGLVATIFGGHKSHYKGTGFVIWVCDSCLCMAEKAGRVYRFYNFESNGESPIEYQDVPIVYHEFDLTSTQKEENGSVT